MLAVPTAVRCLRYCFLRQSACRAAWLGRESSKESNMVLVYLYNSNTRTFQKGRPFFKTSWNKLYRTCNITNLYISTLFALLLPPPVNVSGCLVRERVRKEKTNMVLVYLYNSNTRTFRKGRPFFKTSGNKPPLSDM